MKNIALKHIHPTAECQTKCRVTSLLTRYAFHEAGHAVVGHVLGRCISAVSIRADREQGYRGYCLFNTFAEEMHGERGWITGWHVQRISIFYAGTLAMDILCKARRWDYQRWSRSDKADFATIHTLLNELFSPATPRSQNADELQRELLQGCQQRTRARLLQHWQAVEALAAVLLHRGHIDGCETHWIIQQAIDPTVTNWRMEAWNTQSMLFS
jgi:hypothetical protein